MKEKTYKEKTEDIMEAIREGKKFYVDTYLGRFEVQGVDSDGSMARTGTGFQMRSWAICSREINEWHKQINKEDTIQDLEDDIRGDSEEEILPDSDPQEDDAEFEEHEEQVFRDAKLEKDSEENKMRLEKGQKVEFTAIDDFTGDQLRLDGKIVSEASRYIKSHPELEGEYGNICEGEAYIVKANGHYDTLHLVYPEEILEIKEAK